MKTIKMRSKKQIDYDKACKSVERTMPVIQSFADSGQTTMRIPCVMENGSPKSASTYGSFGIDADVVVSAFRNYGFDCELIIVNGERKVPYANIFVYWKLDKSDLEE